MMRRTLTQGASLAPRSPTAEVTDIMRRVTMVTFVVNATPEVRTRASQGSAEKATGGAVKLGVGTGKEAGAFNLLGALRSAIGVDLEKAKELTDGI